MSQAATRVPRRVGVQVGVGKRNVYLRFEPKAAKLYRSLAGRKARVGCGRQDKESGSGIIVSGGSFDLDTGLNKLIGGGYLSTDHRFRAGAAASISPSSPTRTTSVTSPPSGARPTVCACR